MKSRRHVKHRRLSRALVVKHGEVHGLGASPKGSLLLSLEYLPEMLCAKPGPTGVLVATVTKSGGTDVRMWGRFNRAPLALLAADLLRVAAEGD